MPTGSTPTTKSSAWVRSPAVWAFTFVFFARLLVLANFSHSPYLIPEGEDMKFYNDWALRITKGVADPHAFYGLPGYAYFLAGIYSLTGYNPFTAGLLQCVCEAATGTVLFQLSQAVFDSPGASKDRLLSARGKVVGADADAPAGFVPACWTLGRYAATRLAAIRQNPSSPFAKPRSRYRLRTGPFREDSTMRAQSAVCDATTASSRRCSTPRPITRQLIAKPKISLSTTTAAPTRP